jgi:3-oxoacyl-(acyl-carrier-protein) synthase
MTTPLRGRVAVTGIGVISPLGNDAESAFAAAAAGRSGIRRLTGPDHPFADTLASPIAATTAFDPAGLADPATLRMLDRFAQFALAAAQQALDGAGPDVLPADRERVGIFIGTGNGGTHSMDDGYRALYGSNGPGGERVKPFTVLLGMPNAAAAWIGLRHDVRGPNLTYSTACSSSGVAIGEAWRRVAMGELDVAIAGGSEAPLSHGSLRAWDALHTLAAVDDDDPAASCKPFSKNRSGLVLGEGAAILVLEPWDRARARGAMVLGEIAGYGSGNDTLHITRPGVDGQAAAMRAALRSAQLAPEAVDAINAHGTGTAANDAVETAAIRAVFGAHADRLLVSATKSMHGHLLGAVGAIECALSLLAMRHGIALPTMHLRQPDPACDLDYVPNSARCAPQVATMLSSSFAFGGTHAVLALRAAS